MKKIFYKENLILLGLVILLTLLNFTKSDIMVRDFCGLAQYETNKEFDNLLEYIYSQSKKNEIEGVLDNSDFIKLKKSNMKDAINHLKWNLSYNYEIIPQTRDTNFPLKIYDLILLSENQVLTYMENGHFEGLGIFKYNISQDGEIDWSIIYTTEI